MRAKRHGLNICHIVLAVLALAALARWAPASAAPWDLPASCAGGTWGEECLHSNGASDSIAQDKDQWLEIATDSTAPLQIRFRLSRTPDDWNCDKAQGNELTLNRFDLAAGAPHRLDTAFARQLKPANALYEWHICFLIGGTVYRGWHGYDPGPGASLHIHCFVGMAQLAAEDSDRYLCPTAEVAPNPGNNSEFAQHCYEDGCLHFPTEADYQRWHAFNPLPEADQDAIALAVLRYGVSHKTYVTANSRNFDIYLQVGGKDPAPSILAALKDSGWRLHPGSAFDGKGMMVVIPSFVGDAAGHVTGGLSAHCGALCAASESYGVKKMGGTWQVDTYKLNWIS